MSAMKLSDHLRQWQGDRADAQAAETLGVPLRTYHNWKIGHRTPRGLALDALQDRLARRVGHANPKTRKRS